MIKSAKIARAVITLTGKGTYLFNDRIQGGRSIKVWGWEREHYELAMQAMALQGIKAKLVTTPVFKNLTWQPGGNLRIHTQET